MQPMTDDISYLWAERVCCVGFAKRACDNPPQPNSAYCPECKNALEGALIARLITLLRSHVRAALAGAPCRSCGDMTICGDYCPACQETGEARRLKAA